MSIEAPHTTGLFAELLEGANALAQRPTLIAERDQAHLEMRAAQDRADRLAQRLTEREAEISDLSNKIRSLEEANAKATFQAKEVGDKLSLVASVLTDVMGNAKAAMELVEPPKPEPTPEPTPMAWSPENPTPSGPDWTGSTTTNSESQVGGPTDLPGTFTHTEGFVDRDRSYQQESDTYHGMIGQSVHNPQSGSVEPTANTTSGSVVAGEGQGAAGPTSNATTIPESPAPVPSASGQESANSTGTSPKPYWEKPQSEEWLSWAKAGNDVAPWVTFNWYEKQELDALKRA